MLKYEIESTEGLDESIAKLYQKSDDGKFRLGIEGLDTGEALKAALSKERNDHKKAKEEAFLARKALEEYKSEVETEKLKKSGKYDEIQANFDKKLEEIENRYKEQIANRDAATVKATKESLVSSIASEIGRNPKALMPHLESRIQVEIEDGNTRTIFLDDKGNPSELTKDRFVQEFSKTDYLSDLIIGSKGSGGGAGGSGGDGGATSSKKPNEMSEQERIRLKQESPDKFQATFGRRSA